MRIIAIDPGYERLGIAILEKECDGEKLLYSSCFTTSAKEEFSKRLLQIGERLRATIEEWKPEVLAIEKLYIEKNQKTAMRVAEARGVVVYEAGRANLRIHEFTPLEIKTAITGYGKADKQQMMLMVRKLVRAEIESVSDDEFDAIAAGLTCFAYGKK